MSKSAVRDIRLVLTDMDGTVVMPGEHEVSQRVREAVVAVENAGVSVTAVTGRPYDMAKNALVLLGFEDLCVLDGGATVQHALTGEIVWSKWLDPETIKQIVRIVLPDCLLLDYEPGFSTRLPGDADIDMITEAAPYVFAAFPPEMLQDCLERLAAVPDVTTHVHQGISDFKNALTVQVTHAEADKYHGVEALLNLKHVKREHVLAIGDGDNDIPLFREAGLRIAMGNATERLKAEADYVVAGVEDDGFAEAMQRFVLR